MGARSLTSLSWELLYKREQRLYSSYEELIFKGFGTNATPLCTITDPAIWSSRQTLSLSLSGFVCTPDEFQFIWKEKWHKSDFALNKLQTKKKENYYVISVCLGQAKGSICLNENYDKPQKKISKIYDLSCRVLICPLWSRQSQCHELRPENEYIKEIFPLENFFYVLL